ncbi:MAG: heme exporter protein CcmB [Vicinamibacteria bacterium]|jgi:heme exporter protein B|nr:heme exporter protein CcmB [Vicinamibacteria bacterium]
MATLRAISWALRRELLLLWRTRARAVSAFMFGLTAILLFSFAVGPDTLTLRQNAPGFLWLALLFASTLTLAESMQLEMEQRALEGLLLLPVSARVLYFGKALCNSIQLSLMGAALLPPLIVLCDAEINRPWLLLLVIVLGASGLAAPGTLYAGMTSQVRAKQVLLPLLLFPLVVPMLLAAAKATALIMAGDPLSQASAWLNLMIGFAVLHWTLGGLLFEQAIEE